MRFLRLLVSIAGLIGFAALCFGQAKSGIVPDTRFDFTAPAGPYSKVQTALGTLTSTIPLIHLKGLGNTSLDVDITWRSNIVSGTRFPETDATPGAGWTLSCFNSIQVSHDPSGVSGPAHFQAGDAIEWWRLNAGSYIPFNGVRGVLSATSGGYILTDERSLNQYAYTTGGGNQVELLSSETDIFGNQVSYTYALDANGKERIAQITDASGRTAAFNYSTSSPYLLTSIVLTAGAQTRTWSFATSSGELTGVVFPSATSGGATNPTLNLTYDGNGNISTLKDFNGNLWTYAYATSSYSPQPGTSNPLVVSSVEHPLMTSNGNYDPSAARAGQSDTSDATTYSWGAYTDSSNPSLSLYACTISEPSGGWSGSASYRSRYHVYYNGYPNGSGGVVTYFLPIYQVVDANVAADGQSGGANGYHETYTWNVSDFTLANYKDRRGETTTYTYPTTGVLANTGLPGSKTTLDGYEVQYFYSGAYRLIETVDNMDTSIGGDRVVYQYLSNNALMSKDLDPSSDPYGITAGYSAYNPVNPLDITTTWNYNTNGTVSSVQTGTDTAVQYQYDSYGNLSSITTASGNTWGYTFDELGNKTQEVPPSGGPAGTTNWTYDNLNRLTTISYPDSSTVAITYDPNSNQLTRTDQNGHVTTVAYDQEDRSYSVQRDVDGQAADDIIDAVSFDRASNQVQVTDGRNLPSSYSFDERHYATGVTYPDGTTRRYHFDGNGNRDKAIDGKGYETDYSFDPANRPAVTNYKHDNRVVTVSYRLDGLRSQVTDTFYGGGTWIWNYNGAKLVTLSYQPLPNAEVYYGYNSQSGRRYYMASSPEAWIYNYDSAGRLGSVTQYFGDTTPAIYTYNADDDVSAKTLGNGWSVAYSYNSKRQITGMTHAFDGATQTTLGYARDSVGNITSYNRTQGVNGLATNYSYDRANRLILERRNPVGYWSGSLSYNIAYVYDKSDNRSSVTRNSNTSYVTVSSNNEFEGGDGWGQGSYDADGNAAWLVGPNCGVFPVNYNQENQPTFEWFSSGVFEEPYYDMDHRLVATYSGAFASFTTYIYDGADVIAILSPSATTYRLPGVGEYSTAHGEIYQMEDATGNTIGETSYPNVYKGLYDFDSYGTEYDITSLPAGSSAFRYKGLYGYQTDMASGLVFAGVRQYVPGLGRFLTQDPAGQREDLNLYEYAFDDPLNEVEPSGSAGIGNIRTAGSYRPPVPQIDLLGVLSRPKIFITHSPGVADSGVSLGPIPAPASR